MIRLLTAVLILVCSFTEAATLRHPELDSASQIPGQARDDEHEKVFQGCDGGMMIHSGYVCGTIPSIGYHAAGGVIGLGGVARAHLWKHWRIGGEGYVTTEPLNFNDSYIRWGWGGLLVDWYHNLGRFMPYVGITIGGGAKTDCLIFENGAEQGDPIQNGYYRKQGFFAVDPNIGCDYLLNDKVHLTLKLDCLCCISDAQLLQPTGPRIYFGVIFYH